MQPRDVTYQERISDNPDRAIATNTGALAKVKEGAYTKTVATATETRVFTDVEVLGIDWP